MCMKPQKTQKIQSNLEQELNGDITLPLFQITLIQMIWSFGTVMQTNI